MKFIDLNILDRFNKSVGVLSSAETIHTGVKNFRPSNFEGLKFVKNDAFVRTPEIKSQVVGGQNNNFSELFRREISILRILLKTQILKFLAVKV